MLAAVCALGLRTWMARKRVVLARGPHARPHGGRRHHRRVAPSRTIGSLGELGVGLRQVARRPHGVGVGAERPDQQLGLRLVRRLGRRRAARPTPAATAVATRITPSQRRRMGRDRSVPQGPPERGGGSRPGSTRWVTGRSWTRMREMESGPPTLMRGSRSQSGRRRRHAAVGGEANADPARPRRRRWRRRRGRPGRRTPGPSRARWLGGPRSSRRSRRPALGRDVGRGTGGARVAADRQALGGHAPQLLHESVAGAGSGSRRLQHLGDEGHGLGVGPAGRRVRSRRNAAARSAAVASGQVRPSASSRARRGGRRRPGAAGPTRTSGAGPGSRWARTWWRAPRGGAAPARRAPRCTRRRRRR